jgi:hypothetical protein
MVRAIVARELKLTVTVLIFIATRGSPETAVWSTQSEPPERRADDIASLSESLPAQDFRAPTISGFIRFGQQHIAWNG